MLTFLLTDKAEDFRQVINKTEEICKYLTKTCDYDLREDYKKQTLHYKEAVFNLSYEYFNSKQKLKDKQIYKEALYQEELKFRKNALEAHQDTLRFCLKILTNFITHCTGIGLIFNAINKYKTGNWFLFNHNEHIDMIRDNRMILCNQFDISP